ncbi:hypothetical protein FXW07_00715 [Methanosarcina sp. DH1]|uniref:restriction endonuclease subunit S n=1 Tax=Methanosarcina sp. DH1 TaxID=2605695 RepID=UPI001E5322AC|nr:restriction endonuclease subunit S [Methanosarcina sp. DH1]MCC4765199.1 hypothetical protein [Methanosarcina sp. DH1]
MSGLVDGVNENIQVKNDQEKYDVKLGIREWKCYPEYKDSGVEWIGEIPNFYKITKVKYVCSVNGRIGFRGYTTQDLVSENEGALTLGAAQIDNNGNIDLTAPVYISWKKYYESPEIMVKREDVLIVQRGSCGRVGFVKEEIGHATINPSLIILKSNDSIMSKYLFYYLSSSFVRNVFNMLLSSTAVPMLSQEQISNVPVILADRKEQTKIVSYLDRETAKIDTLIEKKQRLIELLEEKRSALISNVVTKGLDADMKMKDSGVEWIRMIPENWEMTKNGLLFNQRDERDFPDLPILQVSISKGVTLREFSKDRVEQMAEDPATYKRTKKGDIVFNKMRMWQGAIGVAPQDGLVSPDYTVAKPIETVNPRYFELQFRTDFYKTEVNRYSYGIVSDRNRLYWDGFKQIKSISPPFEEQNIIVNFLDSETEKIDTFINKISAQIEKLKEYRTALISAAVTGKIDVREEVA